MSFVYYRPLRVRTHVLCLLSAPTGENACLLFIIPAFESCKVTAHYPLSCLIMFLMCNCCLQTPSLTVFNVDYSIIIIVFNVDYSIIIIVFNVDYSIIIMVKYTVNH